MGVTETLLLIIALILVAMVLIVVEIVTPTFGVLGIAAVVAVGVAVYFCYTLDKAVGLGATIAAIVLLPVYTVIAVKVLPKTSLGRKIGLHREPTPAGEGTPEAADLSRFVGRTTVAETSLRPSGFVRIDGKRIVAEAETGMIAKSEKVKVIRAGGTSVTVRKVST